MLQKSESESHSGVSNSLWPQGLNSPRNSPGQNIGVGSHSLLQGFFLIQGSNPGLPHCRWILYQLSHKGSAWCTVRPKKQKYIYIEFIQLNTKKATWLKSGQIWIDMFQRRCADGQQIHEKMCNVINHQENENENHTEISPHTCVNVTY